MPIAVNGPIKPISTIELTLPDGTKFSEEVYATIEESHYAKDKCDVKIGDCWCQGDLHHYDVVFKDKTMSARLTLDGTIRAWCLQQYHIKENKFNITVQCNVSSALH